MVGIPEKLISNGTYVRRSFGVCLIYFRLFYHFIVFLCFSLCQMGSNWEWWAFRQYVVRSKIHHYVTKKTFQLMKCRQGIWQVASQETNKLSNQYRELMRRSSLISTFTIKIPIWNFFFQKSWHAMGAVGEPSDINMCNFRVNGQPPKIFELFRYKCETKSPNWQRKRGSCCYRLYKECAWQCPAQNNNSPDSRKLVALNMNSMDSWVCGFVIALLLSR